MEDPVRRAQLVLREQDGEWDIELDLQEQQPGIIGGDLIAAGAIASDVYTESLRKGTAFIVTTFQDHSRRYRS